jgi:hypothetical protein
MGAHAKQPKQRTNATPDGFPHFAENAWQRLCNQSRDNCQLPFVDDTQEILFATCTLPTSELAEFTGDSSLGDSVMGVMKKFQSSR